MQSVKTKSFVRLSDSALTPSDPDQDIRGRKVIDRAGDEIGEVKSFFVDEDERRVRFFEIESGGLFGLGGETRLIPTDAIEGVTEDFVRVGASREVVTGSPAYDPNLTEDQRYWLALYGYYGYPPYWSQR
jgi:sporulation protein YlmC with PRC-barrel domain